MDHPVEWLRHLPHFLDPECPDLRVLALQAEAFERNAGEMPLRSLREDGHARDDVRPGLEVPELFAVAATPLVARADAASPPAVHEQRVGGRLGEEHRAALLSLLGEPAAEPRQRGDMVAVVLHRRRRRDPQRAIGGQEVHRFVLNRSVERHVLDALPSLEQTAEGTRIHDCA